MNHTANVQDAMTRIGAVSEGDAPFPGVVGGVDSGVVGRVALPYT